MCASIRLKYLARSPVASGVGEAAQEQSPGSIRYIRTTDIESLWSLSDDNIAYLPKDIGEKALVEEGDLLMSSAGTVGKTTLVGEITEPMCYAGFLVRFQADRSVCDPRFVAYWTQSKHFRAQVDAGKIVTTIANFSATRYKNLELDLPPLEEQQSIVALLDERTHKLDALIAEKRRQNSLLQERFRAALVSQFIVPNPQQLPTGRRLKYLFEFVRGGFWGDEPTGGPDDVTCVRVADFDRFTFRVGADSPTIRSVPPAQAAPRILRPGDVLLEKSGGTGDKPVGCAVSYEGDGRAVCSNFVAQLRPRGEHNARFLGLLMAAHYQAKLNSPSVKRTTGIQNLDLSAYLSQYAHVPSRAAQDAIVDEVDHDLDLAVRATVELERSGQLLEERRTAVITELVCGRTGVPA